ncbi:UNVERIFIED_CONTAM: hypothetical protein GTU68_066249 [Idotea baltica]|nr:hypothetical protein [Idotea baltica]
MIDFFVAVQALVLGLIEGLTEFLPISSTGHQIIAADLLGFTGERAMAFNIIIQLGAILAVVWAFKNKIYHTIRFTLNLIVAFLPAVVLGVCFADIIHAYLFNPITVATALVIGGFIMLWSEKRIHAAHIETIDQMTWRDALKVGFAQCVAMIPGTSRSGATIVGGLWFGLSRQAATEFSFFLAIPTMLGAAVYSGYKYRDVFQMQDIPVFVLGFITAFIVAMLSVNFLLRFIAKHSYAVFAWYRIAFGLIILCSWQFHWIDWSTANG